jgi:hypothetical protein
LWYILIYTRPLFTCVTYSAFSPKSIIFDTSVTGFDITCFDITGFDITGFDITGFDIVGFDITDLDFNHEKVGRLFDEKGVCIGRVNDDC